MVLPCQVKLGPSRFHWFCKVGTTAYADFCWHRSGYPDRPVFQASLTHGYAQQISPNKNVNFRCASSPSTLESVGNGLVVHGQLTSGSLWASMAFLFVASQLRRECGWRDSCQRDHTHSQASSPRFVASPQLPSSNTSVDWLHLVYCPPSQFPFSYRGLAPHEFTPMSGVPFDRRSGRWRS